MIDQWIIFLWPQEGEDEVESTKGSNKILIWGWDHSKTHVLSNVKQARYVGLANKSPRHTEVYVI